MEIISSILNRSNSSIIMVTIVIGSVLTSFFIPYFSGLYMSEVFNPTKIHYGCACDASPILSKFQANIACGTYFIYLSVALYHILRLLGLSKYRLWIWLIVLFIFNGTSCFIAMDILSTEVSG